MRFPIPAVAALAAALFLAGCGTAPSTASAASVKAPGARKPAPDFTLKDANGKPVKLSDFKGKVVLLNFWATWCGPCKIEIPWFIEFEQTYRDKGLVVLGVAMDEEGWEAVKPYMERNKINYRMVVGDDMTAQRYGGVESLPTTFLIDREGRIANTHIGLVSKKDYLNDITNLIGDAKAAILSTPAAPSAGAN